MTARFDPIREAKAALRKSITCRGDDVDRERATPDLEAQRIAQACRKKQKIGT